MARASAAKTMEDQPELEVAPVVEMVTYVPATIGDPVQVTWCGHVFHANTPKEIRGHANGSARDKLNAELIERARENKCFVVGNGKPKRDPVKAPQTPEEYRVYFVEWLKDSEIQHAEQLIARFAKDRELQHLCGIGTDDYDMMRDLFMSKLHQLSKADELSQGQVSDMWIRHGYNLLPW